MPLERQAIAASIANWVKNGAPEGDPKDLPPSRHVHRGWQIPQPDQVIYMADEPYDVPAEGTVEYQRFVIDPGWTEDKWIKAIECKPGNPAIVHHIIVYVIPPGVAPTGRAGRLQTNWLGAFAPGLRQEPLPEGLRPLRAEGLEAAVRDALHAQRRRAARPQLCGLRVRRSRRR